MFLIDELMFGLATVESSKHRYTLASTGFKIREDVFYTRRDAEIRMHEIMQKNNLHIVKSYDDKHYKTYICENNIRFYINRV